MQQRCEKDILEVLGVRLIYKYIWVSSAYTHSSLWFVSLWHCRKEVYKKEMILVEAKNLVELQI